MPHSCFAVPSLQETKFPYQNCHFSSVITSENWISQRQVKKTQRFLTQICDLTSQVFHHVCQNSLVQETHDLERCHQDHNYDNARTCTSTLAVCLWNMPLPTDLHYLIPIWFHYNFQKHFTGECRNRRCQNLKPAYHAVGGLTEWHNIKSIYSGDLSSGKKAKPPVLTCQCKNAMTNLASFVCTFMIWTEVFEIK